MILATGHVLLGETGLAGFSAREVAKRAGYTVGTIYNVFGSLDRLVIALNTRTFPLWTDWIRRALDASPGDRIAALVDGYFGFARAHPRWWTAIYDHHLPPGTRLPEEDERTRGVLTEMIVQEVAAALGRPPDPDVHTLARSLIATVHGHCAFTLSGAWALMGEGEPEAVATARVRESLAAAAAD